VSAGICFSARAQHVPSARGSLDAVTVLPTTLPAGHPSTMPAGHPAIPTTQADPMKAMHEGMTAAKSGALRVNISQGTKDGPAIGKDPVRVDLLSQGVVIKTIRTTVGEKGVVELRDLPLDVPFQPVITVTHGNAEQQKVGAVIHKYQPAIEFDMPVFETTADKPSWTIGLRGIECDVVVSPENASQLYVRVADMIGGFNPADKAWLGEGSGESRTTLSLPLPEGAGNVQYGPGMLEAGAKVVDKTVIRGKTMIPGSTQYIYAFDVPVKDGKAAVSFTTPVDTALFALYIPATWNVEKATNVEVAPASGNHGSNGAKLLKAKTLKAGTVVTVAFSGITPPPVPATKPGEILDHNTDLKLPQPPAK
jgi:hypothetical protein